MVSIDSKRLRPSCYSLINRQSFLGLAISGIFCPVDGRSLELVDGTDLEACKGVKRVFVSHDSQGGWWSIMRE